MLVLTLTPNVPVRIGDDITVTLLESKMGQARLSFKAPKHIRILRDNAKVRKPKT